MLPSGHQLWSARNPPMFFHDFLIDADWFVSGISQRPAKFDDKGGYLFINIPFITIHPVIIPIKHDWARYFYILSFWNSSILPLAAFGLGFQQCMFRCVRKTFSTTFDQGSVDQQQKNLEHSTNLPMWFEFPIYIYIFSHDFPISRWLSSQVTKFFKQYPLVI